MGWLSTIINNAGSLQNDIPNSPLAYGMAALSPIGLGVPGLYNDIANAIAPTAPALQNPAAAPSAPNPGQAASDAATQTLQTESQQARSSSYLPFTESLDPGAAPQGPSVTSRMLLGS